jgi:hemerythrin-like domain-containing protein
MKATELLKRQHRAVKKLFAQARRSTRPDERESLLDQIETDLRRHMYLEETIFYPAIRDAAKAKKSQEMIGEAYEEHAVVKLVLNTFATLDPEDERFEAKMTVLDELIQHHVDDEESEIFAAAEKLGDDEIERLGEEMGEAAAEGGDEMEDDYGADEEGAELPLGHRHQ